MTFIFQHFPSVTHAYPQAYPPPLRAWSIEKLEAMTANRPMTRPKSENWLCALSNRASLIPPLHSISETEMYHEHLSAQCDAVSKFRVLSIKP
jgi:hypothetical protein